MIMAVFTFLEQFDWSGKKIYPFVTHEGSMAKHTKSKVENRIKDIT